MSLYGSGAEYGLHCLLSLVNPPRGGPPSSKDLAEFQGISPSYVAKLFTQMEQAGITTSAEGVRGGYSLARPADTITVLEVVDALEGRKPLFKCRDVRQGCALFTDTPPKWATRGLCSIHAVMLQGEKKMREALSSFTLADLAGDMNRKIPGSFLDQKNDWFQERNAGRNRKSKPINKRKE